MDKEINTIDYDSTLRLYNIDLRHKVRGVWDENIPIINHTVIEARGLSSIFLDSSKDLRKSCDLFCDDVGLSIVDRRVHAFEPIGKTVFYVLEESHLSVHTWPEKGYLHLDLVTCSKDEMLPLEMATIFNRYFKPTHLRHMKIKY
jgi:S-adenosylmethionine decarboxylase